MEYDDIDKNEMMEQRKLKIVKVLHNFLLIFIECLMFLDVYLV